VAVSGKHLTLLRHAKSSWADPEIPDHDRPLNARGRRAAALVGGYLRRAGCQPDLVLCSSATRTRETLELLDLAPNTDVLIEDQLYGASATTLLARLGTVPDVVRSVLLIGHNPGIEDLARTLAADGAVLGSAYPTAALASFDLPVPTWAEVGPGVGELRDFILPRDLD